MNAVSPQFESQCRAILDRFFAAHPDAALEKRAHKALQMLRTSDRPLKGKPEGWAAGIIYTLTTAGRFPCGVPRLPNAKFEELMHVSMGTARYLAARVQKLLEI